MRIVLGALGSLTSLCMRVDRRATTWPSRRSDGSNSKVWRCHDEILPRDCGYKPWPQKCWCVGLIVLFSFGPRPFVLLENVLAILSKKKELRQLLLYVLKDFFS